MRSFQIVGYAGGLIFLGLGLTFFSGDWQAGLGFIGVAIFCVCWGVALGHYLKRNRTSGLRWGSLGCGALGLVILGLAILVDDAGAGLTSKRLIVAVVAALMVGFPLFVFGRPSVTNL